ncbi:MAG: hypothetical protein HYT37_01120 [Candidatus Sungbacteria bacterium]|nr:hypothetical protein [Candidatus Sungbacteria bacterium]
MAKKAFDVVEGVWGGLVMTLAVLVLLFEVGQPLEQTFITWWSANPVVFIGLVLLFAVGALGHHHQNNSPPKENT